MYCLGRVSGGTRLRLLRLRLLRLANNEPGSSHSQAQAYRRRARQKIRENIELMVEFRGAVHMLQHSRLITLLFYTLPRGSVPPWSGLANMPGQQCSAYVTHPGRLIISR